jgi:hypothetical protein
MISEFYNIQYEEADSFEPIYLKIKNLTDNIDSHLKKLLR